ncbi:ankyrin [Hesseltinella vesiculosa]|uniref:Ankyrin n=1 Tax=Hesseltinella vesiculosa TaxID=101127 RepID=A0A1X2GVK5_9FUNG|nr:ankyrin [Hesseltinella vesiculosa]
MIAVSSGRDQVVQILLENGANVNAQNESGQTPLLYAASKNRLDIAKVLLNHGADVNLVNHIKQSPL